MHLCVEHAVNKGGALIETKEWCISPKSEMKKAYVTDFCLKYVLDVHYLHRP